MHPSEPLASAESRGHCLQGMGFEIWCDGWSSCEGLRSVRLPFASPCRPACSAVPAATSQIWRKGSLRVRQLGGLPCSEELDLASRKTSSWSEHQPLTCKPWSLRTLRVAAWLSVLWTGPLRRIFALCSERLLACGQQGPGIRGVMREIRERDVKIPSSCKASLNLNPKSYTSQNLKAKRPVSLYACHCDTRLLQ